MLTSPVFLSFIRPHVPAALIGLLLGGGSATAVFRRPATEPVPVNPAAPVNPGVNPAGEATGPTGIRTGGDTQRSGSTGGPCSPEIALYCAPLLTADWKSWCEQQDYSGLNVINPCANRKYSRDACIESALQWGWTVSPECAADMDAINDANADLRASCGYTTQRGGLCADAKPTPAPGDWDRATQGEWVSPWVTCLLLQQTAGQLTPACSAAVTTHETVKWTAPRAP